MTDKQVSGTRTIAASPEKIFALLADPSKHATFDGSGTVQGSRSSAPAKLSKGATFGMAMKIRVPYPITNTVTEYEEGRRIAWRHFARHTWRYELEPVEGGTRVTETFDWGTALVPKLLELGGYPEKSKKAIDATLERLEEIVTQAP